MRAGVFHGPGDVRVEEVEDPKIREPGDAVVRIVRSSVCGSDLWPYRGVADWKPGWRTGHELTGVVEEVAGDVEGVSPGDLVVSAFAWSCGHCEFCRGGLHTSCVRGAYPGEADQDGGQAERVRVPLVDGSVWKVPDGTPEERLDSVHLLSDVLLTGYHAARLAGVGAPGLDGEPVRTAVVIGDGAVGLSAVASARLLGARTVIAVGHHAERLEIAAALGADHTTQLAGEELYGHVRELTDGGAPAVLECVGVTGSLRDAAHVARPGGSIGMVGVPAGVDGVPLAKLFSNNIALRAGVAPVRAYMDEVGPSVANGDLDVAAIASHRFALDDLAEAYAAMDRRECVKAIVLP